MKIIKLQIYIDNFIKENIFLYFRKLSNFLLIKNILELSTSNKFDKFKSIKIKYIKKLLILFKEIIQQNLQ